MKVLFIVLGEAFRTGGQYSRITGRPESYEQQISACKSHIKLIEHIEKQRKSTIDVCIGTYHTNFNNDLYAIYQKYEKHRHIHHEKIGITGLFRYSVNEINMNDYDFVFYIRIDLVLKDKLFECNLFDKKRILFPFVCFTINNCDKIGKYPRICDTFSIIPKKWYNILHNIEFNHSSWKNLMVNNNLRLKDIDTVIHTYHDSDSEKDRNPLYYIANRPQCSSSYNNETQIFNKYNYGITKIIVVGPKHSGSTMLFNLFIKIYEYQGKSVFSGWHINPQDYSNNVDVLIDKRHDCDVSILQNYDFVFLPLRHLLDSAMTSKIRFNIPYVDSCYENIYLFEKFKIHSDYIFKYENHSVFVVKEIIKTLCIDIDLNTIFKIMNELENMKNSKDIVKTDDHNNSLYRKTLLSQNHNTSGGMVNKYVYLMEPNLRNTLLQDKKVFDFLVKYKYI
jgi:hypothetical protein